MENKTMIQDFTTGSIPKQLIAFASPFMLANLLQTMYAMVDMVVVGQTNGSAALSAVSIGGMLVNFLTFLCIGFASAGQIMIAQYVGRNDRTGISKTIGTMTVFLLACGLIFGILTVVFTKQVLTLMNTPAESFEQATVYMVICNAGMVFIYGYNIVSSILRGMGDSVRPLYFIAIATVINIVLDLLLVAGLGMGASGAAWATVIGQTVSFITSVVYLFRKRENLGFEICKEDFRIHGETFGKLMKLGGPMALQHAAISISTLTVNSFLNSYGVAVAAMTGIGSKLLSVIGIITRAISASDSTMVAQNMGAGKIDRVRELTGYALVFTAIPTIILCAICYACPLFVTRIFTQDPETLALAPVYTKIVVIGFLACSVMGPFMAVINGIGFASLAFITGMLDGVIMRIGLAVLFGSVMDMGYIGYWWGDSLAPYATVAIAMVYYFSGKWKTHKLIVD